MPPKKSKLTKPDITEDRQKTISITPKAYEEPVRLLPNGCIAIAIRAKPNSKQSGVISVGEECVEVQIAAPPIDGEANAELIRFLSDVLEVRKTFVSVDRGNKSRVKSVLLEHGSGLTVEKVKDLLKNNSI